MLFAIYGNLVLILLYRRHGIPTCRSRERKQLASSGSWRYVKLFLLAALPYADATIVVGKSDPYAVFNLNGQRVFKSDTKKKTLAPVWDQSFTALVVS